MVEKKQYNKKFIEYQKKIVENPNYTGLAIERKSNGELSWVASKQSKIGKERLDWANKKIIEHEITGDDKYAQLMFLIHPTKIKVCQICGSEMSLYYIYLNATLIKSIEKNFNLKFTTNDSLSDVYPILCKTKGERFTKEFLVKEFRLNNTYLLSEGEILIDACETVCRVDKVCKKLGPGAMSNFPDRFDGFHSYNRCCRQTEDKGRQKENMYTYAKDRRAYEYWSDGNICSANGFMHSNYFRGYSADHIGPISLGFVHDSVYLKKMPTGDNSSKRDKLLYDDIKLIIDIEEKTGIPATNGYVRLIWAYLKSNIKSGKIVSNGTKLEKIRLMFKQMTSDYMYVLKKIKDAPQGKEFLVDAIIMPKYKAFEYEYTWDIEGNIITKTPRRINDANRAEIDRMKRISLESLDDYNSKSNRNVTADLTYAEEQDSNHLIRQIYILKDSASILNLLNTLVEKIQNRLIANNKSVC